MKLIAAPIVRVAALSVAVCALQGCVVLAVADLAATTVVKTAGLAVDATVGAAKMVGSAITPGSGKEQDKSKDKK